jgi:anti-sigma regulatory factor (Ser/Thr protein kinase)
MGPDTIWVLIPIMGMMIPIVAIWTKHQQKIAEMQIGVTAENTAEKAAQYATHIQRLEDRVQVLERIVTDRGYDIATRIEALRDTRRVDADMLGGSGVPLSLEKKERA